MAFKSRIKPQSKEASRLQNRRDERKVADALPLICFSFKDYDDKQCPPGQTYAEWQTDKRLAYMLEKFGYICQCTVPEAQQKKWLKIYGDFPARSDFKVPPHVDGDVKWAVIMDIKGQKPRVAGYMIDNVFYVVFLDHDHLFFKMSAR